MELTLEEKRIAKEQAVFEAPSVRARPRSTMKCGGH